MAKENLGKLFKRFYQEGQSVLSEYKGTGIGLSLTKELVQLHGGEIDVESEIGKGTKFTFWLPTQLQNNTNVKPYTNQNAIITEHETIDLPLSHEHILDTVNQYQSLNTDEKNSRNLPILLIIDDNPDIIQYIASDLQESYFIIEARNGQQGIEKAIETIPDLIISDVKMPVMDGIEMCYTLKSDQRTSHIPIVLLTAFSSDEHRIKGLETGADAYVSKPFSIQELKVRIKNLIQLRKSLIERYQKTINIQPGEITVTSVDEEFLKKAIKLVDDNISDTGFGVVQLSAEIGMSRSNLFRKLKAITGQKPNDFIRDIRLKRAAFLLVNSHFNVSEVAYQVGFNELGYFGKAFRKYFGMSATDFAKTTRKTKAGQTINPTFSFFRQITKVNNFRPTAT
ncbi:MAG: response regulator [Bacteroidales bacterium]|nr:response regulator [Bacteroidales bacterium]